VRRAPRSLLLALAFAVASGAGLLALAQSPPPPAPPAPAAPPSATVKITFITVPMKKAEVLWGKRRLGVIAPRQPLVIERPRDSGPLDVVVKSDGYLSVQTRAYTFADSKVAVKLTPLDQKNTLLGYREEVVPDGGVPDGGAPSASTAPAPRAPGADAGAR
jgi:hypothetical protein